MKKLTADVLSLRSAIDKVITSKKKQKFPMVLKYDDLLPWTDINKTTIKKLVSQLEHANLFEIKNGNKEEFQIRDKVMIYVFLSMPFAIESWAYLCLIAGIVIKSIESQLPKPNETITVDWPYCKLQQAKIATELFLSPFNFCDRFTIWERNICYTNINLSALEKAKLYIHGIFKFFNTDLSNEELHQKYQRKDFGDDGSISLFSLDDDDDDKDLIRIDNNKLIYYGKEYPLKRMSKSIKFLRVLLNNYGEEVSNEAFRSQLGMQSTQNLKYVIDKIKTYKYILADDLVKNGIPTEIANELKSHISPTGNGYVFALR